MLARGRWFFDFVVALSLVLAAERVIAAEALAQRATVFGTPTANLRAGPGVEHNLKLTLKEGDAVTLNKLEGEWYLVTTADGQQGYIHKNLLKLDENVAAQPQVAPPPATPATGKSQGVGAPPIRAAKTPPIDAAAANVDGARAKTTGGKAPSLLQMLDAHESEVKIGLLVAAIAFVIGWFCGGHYYLRREHKYRRRLRL